jgi:multidrug resistance protein, MATE family
MHIVTLLRSDRIRIRAKESWSVCWPMTLIMFFIAIIGLTDIYVAGRFGKEAQAAYGLSFQLYFVMSIIGTALSVGSVSVVSRLFTSGRKEACREAVDSSVAMAAVSGLILGILGFVFSRHIIDMLSVPHELKPLAVAVTKIYSVGVFFNYLLMATNGLLRACGEIRRSLWTMFAVCVVNVILVFYYAFYTPLGARGIAWATVSSALVGCIGNAVAMRTLIAGRIRVSVITMQRIFDIGWPSGLLQIFWQLGAMAVFLIISALPHNRVEILAAYTNGLRIESIIFLPAFAFNMANAVVVGNMLGKGDSRGAFTAGAVTAAMGVVLVAVMTGIVIFNARSIAAFLSKNDIVVSESIRYLYIAFISEPFMAWSVILAGGLNGAGDTRSVMAVIAVSIWIVRLPLCYLLGIYWGYGAVMIWWSMNISLFVQAILITKRYFARGWLLQKEFVNELGS